MRPSTPSSQQKYSDCLALFLKYSGTQHARIEREMRAKGHGKFSRRILYSRFERGVRKPGWIARYDWKQLLSEPGAGRGPQSGIPTGVVDATGFSRDESPTLNNSGLKHSYDGYGRDIYIEKETDDGKPKIWYRRAPSGTIHRSERKGFGIRNSVVKEMGSEDQHATS
jgi:hypothetical protein